MKRTVLVLMILVLAVSVNANYLPYPDSVFAYKAAACDDKGIITLNLSHQGRPLAFSDVSFIIENDIMKQPLIGEWYRGEYPADNYEGLKANSTGANYVSQIRFKYISGHEIYTKGTYKITLSWPSSTEYYDHISFSVICPGIPCKNNDGCIQQHACVDNICEWVDCGDADYAMGHTCYTKCDDGNKCTKDYYADNKCTYIPIKDCCNTYKECSAGMYCKKNICTPETIIQKINIFAKLWNWIASKYSS